MPTRNRVKVYIPNTYYHLYNRGWNRTEIFKEHDDYEYFEWLLSRHCSPEPVKDRKGREYAYYSNDVRILAYCLMPNHFHLLVYQFDEPNMIAKLMASILTAYTMYFNKKYHRRGSLFESTYKAVPVVKDEQLLHITRYIHLNHKDFRAWPYSSYLDYIYTSDKDWLETQPILDLFTSIERYVEFVDDYEQLQRERDSIKAELANG